MTGSSSSSSSRSNPWLISHDELPDWATDNHFIVAGYRRPGGWTTEAQKGKTLGSKHANGSSNASSTATDMIAYEHNTFRKCWNSMWAYWHNETINIHTHFWGCLFACSLLLFHSQHLLFPLLSPRLPHLIRYIAHAPIFYPASISFAPSSGSSGIANANASRAGWFSLAHVPTEYSHPPGVRDIAGFGTFFLGSVVCLGFSATFHCCTCHSRRISASFNKLDYIGIVVMIVGSFLPALHYGFYCHPHLQTLYATMIVSLGSLAMYTVVAAKYATPAYRPVRTTIFISLGLSAVIPVVHICAMYGYSTVSRIMGLSYVIASGAMYIIGACLYMARIPERFAPGRFDMVGASHQIFHVFILAAAFAHYISLRRSYAFWHSVEHMATPLGQTGTLVGGMDGKGVRQAVSSLLSWVVPGGNGSSGDGNPTAGQSGAVAEWGRQQVCRLLEAHRN